MKPIFTSLLLFIVFISSAQNTFKTRVFAEDDNYLNQVIQLNDGSFISTGYVSISNSEDDAIFLLKTDATGNVLASKSISTSDYDEGMSLIKTTDGGFAIGGNLNDQMGLLKFKADLTLQWEKTYEVENSQTGGWKLIQTPEGGYLLAGAIYNNDADAIAGYVVKTDSQGEALFSKQYLDYIDNRILDITPMKDGNYAFLAVTNWDTNGLDTTYIVKINSGGDILWSKHFYNGSTYVEPSSLIGTSDGGLVMTGGAGFSDNDENLIMVKLNNAGTILWSKHMVPTNTNSDSYAYGVSEDKDGGYLFTGEYDIYDFNDNGDDSNYAYVLKTNALGALQWTKKFDASQGEYTVLTNIITTADGGYAACGLGNYTDDESDYDFAVDLYKFNSNFEICGETAGSNGTTATFGTVQEEGIFTTNLDVTASDVTVTTANVNDTINYICSTLPLQLLSFNATLQNKSVAVQWTTANEVNTSYFTVERSNNANSFTALQQVAAKGNSAGVQSYTTTDLQPLPGTSYYRLKEVDKDGKITYSSVVPVTVLNNGTVIISPNPVQNTVRVVMQSATNASATLQVFDIRGTVLATQKTAVAAGRNEILIPAASLAKGVYLLKVIENNSVQAMRFVKE